ncbi:hypothetical protein Q8F57_039695 [Paraburkholderia terrae]|uniref:hypothetical protein n=1 Tax=Paraburkholderia terrae TaxID=311230 RepID=UPI00296ADCBA|nr:hypothetical protein [Paraburkholderia terrae]MDW3658708.1 hypothetical protein [Paraburkholderia terrae]
MQPLRIKEAIKYSGVKHIAIIDDVFDAPQLGPDDFGPVLDFLQNDDSDQIRIAAKIEESTWQGALESIGSGEYDADDVVDCIKALYDAYVEQFDPKFDPGAKFSTIKADNLKNVRPLISFLQGCGPDISISKFGKNVGEVRIPDGELVVFVDLFLDDKIGANQEPSNTVAASAVMDSIKRIQPLMERNPSVVLMSSHQGRREADEYRKKIQGGRVFASRFAFVEKKQVSQNGTQFVFEDEALFALLDVFDSYKFGRGLHATLDAWTASAEKAIKQMRDEIEALELRDISYLVRFRLAEEGQSLTEYLEWLLSECLVDAIGKKLDESGQSAELAHLLKEEATKIGGAFDGPTENVARLYHRVRVEDSRRIAREQFRLGDLYIRRRKDALEQLVAVMNPDCDLVTRDNKTRNAKSLLTLKGTLQQFDEPKTSVGDFIMIKGKPHNIAWNYDDIQTLPFTENMAKPGQTGGDYEYVGALRPLYAQEIQGRLLNHLGRVGVAVPPALAFGVSLIARYRTKGGGVQTMDLGDPGETQCYYVPPRQSGQTGKAVFTRKFIKNFCAAVANIDGAVIHEDDQKIFTSLKGAKIREKLAESTHGGISLEGQICNGVVLTGKPEYKPSGASKPLCWITLELPDTDVVADSEAIRVPEANGAVASTASQVSAFPMEKPSEAVASPFGSNIGRSDFP